MSDLTDREAVDAVRTALNATYFPAVVTRDLAERLEQALDREAANPAARVLGWFVRRYHGNGNVTALSMMGELQYMADTAGVSLDDCRSLPPPKEAPHD